MEKTENLNRIMTAEAGRLHFAELVSAFKGQGSGFFPKAKSAPYGKTLIKFAWIVEIIVATVGLAIAYFLYTKAVGGPGGDDGKILTFSEKFSENIDGVIVSLAFVVVAIVIIITA